MIRKVFVFAAMGVLAWMGAAMAQSDGATAPRKEGTSPNEQHDVRKLVEEIMAARLSRELELNDEQTVLMLRKLAEFREELQALRKTRQELVKGLQSGLQAGEADAQLETKLNELVAHDAKMADAKRDTWEKAGTGFSVAQRAKLYVFLNDFENEMRKLVQKARERNAQRAGGGGPPDESAPSPQHARKRPWAAKTPPAPSDSDHGEPAKTEPKP